jgi:hypothetical protein
MGSRFQYYVLIPLLFGTIISCTEQENSGPEDHSIHHPFGGEIIYRSTTCRISWNTPSWSSVDIELNSGSDLSWQICEALPNTGSYNWNIPIEIPDGSTYSIRAQIQKIHSLDRRKPAVSKFAHGEKYPLSQTAGTAKLTGQLRSEVSGGWRKILISSLLGKAIAIMILIQTV